MSQTDLDTAIKEVGRFGQYHIFVYCLLFVPLFVAGTSVMSYVFTAAELRYRCRIDECDNLNNNPNGEYLPDWIRNAVPFNEDTGRPETCYKYNLTRVNLDELRCEASDFNRARIKCSDFVYENDKRTIMNDMDLHCDENKWLLALVGTIHNCGNFLNLLVVGYFSDKYGRRVVFIFSAVSAATLSIIRSFSWNYLSYMILEFVQPCITAGAYTSGFILVIEILKPEHRAITSAILFSTMSLGKVFLGALAMIYQDWRSILRFHVALSFVALTYFWLLPESLRWLVSHGKNEEAAKSMLKITRINKTEISAELRDLLENRPHDLVLNADKTQDQIKDSSQENTIMAIFKYPKMVIRVAACTFCWIIILMVFYGLSLIAVSIGGNKYTDFMMVQFVEIPAALCMPFIANRLGRKKIMFGSFVICGAALIGYTFVGDSYGLKLTLFLLGKFAIANAFTNIYIYNSELFPTNLRHTLLGVCGGLGRIGSIAAPQAPLLNFYVKNLSLYIFGVGALIAALVTLYFPETIHTKLPDTIEEALNIGTDTKVKK